jgi:hypothetical protein
MKNLIKLSSLALLTVAVLVTFLSAEAENKLVNIDFEEGNISGWNRWAISEDVSSSANHTPGGQYSFDASLAEDDKQFATGALIQEFEDIAPGSQIEASCWIKTEGLKGPSGSDVYAFLKIEFWSGDEIIASQEAGNLRGTNDWQEVTLSATVPEGTTLVKYLLQLWNADGTGSQGKAYFDDVSLEVTR